jgi:hypothetical protein
VAFAALTTFFYFLHPLIWAQVLMRALMSAPSNGALIVTLGQAIYLLVLVTISARLSFLFVSAAVEEDWPRPAEIWASAKGQTLPIVAAFILYTFLAGLLKCVIIVLPDSPDLHFFALVVGNPYRSFAGYMGDSTWKVAAEVVVGCFGIAWLVGFIGRRYRQSMDRQSMTRAIEAF